MKAKACACAFLTMVVLAACGSAGATSPAVSSGPSGSAAAKTGGSAAASAPIKLVVSYGELVPQTMPVWFAHDSGLMQKNGIDADLRLIVSTTEISALVAGETQLASAGGPVVLNAVGGGADLLVVAAIAGLSPFALYVPESIKSIQELKGKAIGVSRFGSPSDIATKIALRKNNMEPNKDVRFVETGSTQARTAAMIQGTIQGGMVNPLEAATLEKNGFHSIYDLAKEGTPSAQSVVVGRRDWIGSHRNETQHYVDSIVEAMSKLRQDKPQAINVMKTWFKTDDEPLMTKVYDAYTSTGLWPVAPYATTEMFADAVEIVSAEHHRT